MGNWLSTPRQLHFPPSLFSHQCLAVLPAGCSSHLTDPAAPSDTCHIPNVQTWFSCHHSHVCSTRVVCVASAVTVLSFP